MQRNRSIRGFLAAAALGLLATAVHATDNSHSVTQSSASATGLATTGGGLSISFAANSQKAVVSPGANSAGSVSILGQKAAVAGVGGSQSTLGQSVAGNLSFGTGTGAASASGLSSASLSSERSASTGDVSATAKGNVEGVTETLATSGRNGLGIVSAGSSGQYNAAANATRTGIFSTTRTAESVAGVTVGTTPTTQLTLGTGTVGVHNEAAGNASAISKSGSLVSSN